MGHWIPTRDLRCVTRRTGPWCVALVLALSSCIDIQRRPAPEDIAAKRFELVPDKAVIYLFRPEPDFVHDGATVMLDARILGTVYPGNYLRLELPPGRYRLAGFAGDSGVFDVSVQAAQLYFIEHRVTRLMHFDRSNFQLVTEGYGRQSVLRSELLAVP